MLQYRAPRPPSIQELPAYDPPHLRLLFLSNLNWIYMWTAEAIYVTPHGNHPSAIHMAHHVCAPQASNKCSILYFAYANPKC